MTEQEILDLLNQPNISAESLLEECRGPDQQLWRGNSVLYRAFTHKLLAQGYPARALDLAREGQEYLRDDVELQYLLALAARRGGNPRYARSLLAPLLSRATDPQSTLPIKLRVDIVALQGSVLKILSRTSPELFIESAEWYERAAKLPGASELPDVGTFPLINAATVLRLAGNDQRSRELATEVIRRFSASDETLSDPLWRPATLGEAHLLLEEHDIATRYYQQAVTAAAASNRVGELSSVRANLELLRSAGVTADPEFLDKQLGSVVTFSGHMIDSPERIKAGQPLRFPNSPELIAAVSAAIAKVLEKVNANVGFCSLACGGDLLFAKAMLARDAELHIVLPFAQHDFLRTSVNFGQTSEAWRKWRVMFDEVLNAVPENRVRYTTKEPFLGSNELFDFSGRVQQGLAAIRSRERASKPKALFLLDTTIPGQAGGARTMAESWSSRGFESHEVDLNVLRSQLGESIHEFSSPDTPAAPTASCKLKRPVKGLLFADVAGFSGIPEWQLAEFLEDYAKFLHELFVSPIGKAATYANTWGDGIYAVFDHVVDAAAFALELLESSVATPPDWSKYDLGDSSPFRVGLHAGPVFELPDMFQGRSGFSGQHVSRAARIEPTTMRGCAYASEAFAALLTMEDDGQFHIENVGLHSLAKNYDRCQLFRIARGSAADRQYSLHS